jgi:hypothetical protein
MGTIFWVWRWAWQGLIRGRLPQREGNFVAYFEARAQSPPRGSSSAYRIAASAKGFRSLSFGFIE